MEAVDPDEVKLYNAHAAIVRSGDLYTIVLGHHPDKRDFQTDWTKVEGDVRNENDGRADFSNMNDLFRGMRKLGWKMSLPNKHELFL